MGAIFDRTVAVSSVNFMQKPVSTIKDIDGVTRYPTIRDSIKE